MAPVVSRYIARECPINRGRKKEEHASMVTPRRAKTNPYFEVEWPIRMAAGRVIVMPTPTAEPAMAQIVGLRQR